MAKVSVNFQSDDKEVVAAIDKMNRKLAELQAANARLAAQSQDSAKKTKDGLESAVVGAAKSAAAYMTIANAINVVNTELEHKLRLEKESLDLQVQSAPAQRDFLSNMGFATQAEQNKQLQALEAISKKHGVPVAQLYRPGGYAMSGSGGDFDRALEALDYAVGIGRGDEGSTRSLAMGYQSVARASETGSIKDATGIMAAFGGVSNVTSQKDIAENLAPAFGSVKGFGGRDAEAGALISMFTTAMTDTTGQHSGTAAISLAEQLASFLPESDTHTFRGGKKRLDRKGTGLSSTDERIAYMQANPALLEQFMATASFEKKALIPSRDLLTAGTGTAQQYAQNKQAFSDEQRKAQQQNLADILDQPELQNTANTIQGLQAATQNIQLKEMQQALNSGSRDAFKVMRDKMGYNSYATRAVMMSNDLRGVDYAKELAGQAQLQKMMMEMDKPAGQRTERENQQLEMLNMIISAMEKGNENTSSIKRNQRAGNANQHVEGR